MLLCSFPFEITIQILSLPWWAWFCPCHLWTEGSMLFWTRKTRFAIMEDPEGLMKAVSAKGNQLWMFIIGRTDAKAEALIFGPPDGKSWLIGKDSDVGKDWRQRRGGWQRMRWLDSITDSMDINLSKLWENRGAWNSVVHGVAKSQTWLSYWTTTIHGNDYHIPVSHLTPN